jgi:hypothetical protein
MRIALFLFALLPAAQAPLPAQDPDSGAFVIMLGKDTVAVERYTRSGDQLVDDMVLRDRSPVVLRHLVATLKPDGAIARLELDNTIPGGTGSVPSPSVHGVATFATEETFFDVSRNGHATTAHVVTPPGTLPFFNFCYALYEQIGRRARVVGGTAVKVPAIGFGSSATFDLTVRFAGWGSMSVGFGDDAPTLMKLDPAGRIVGADGALTTEKVIVTRVPAVAIAAVAKSFAGRPLGQLSPADSVRAAIGGALVRIDYSRPATRGRKIFGDLVPWNQVWRTGANAATRLTTSADLVIGGKTIPKGSYSVWTLPSPGGWKLIINSQTKAPCEGTACTLPTRPALWGTDYAADSDFARVDLQVAPLPQPVERLTIAIDSQGDGGVLRIDWETTRLAIPFTRK